MISNKIIGVSNLTKYYDEFLAVNQINFSVAKGEIFGFLGPNGAGKTTTVNMLTGITKPTSGKAFVSGYDITKETRKAKKSVGLVPADPYLYDEMTALDNIEFNAKLHGIQKTKRNELAEKLLKIFGLWKRRREKVGNYSTGIKKRLTIVTALVHEPEILFLDEPTSGLDVQSSRQMRELIKDLNEKSNVTIFLTTHNIEEADQLCQRISIIDRGKIVITDSPENLKAVVQKEHIIEVSFNQIEGMIEKIRSLDPINEVLTAGDKFKIHVEDVSKDLPLIFKFAEENDLEIKSINTKKPTLEDSFVKLTGLSPEAMEKGE